MSWRIGKTESVTALVLLLAFALPVSTVYLAFSAARRLTISNRRLNHSQDVLVLNADVQLKVGQAARALHQFEGNHDAVAEATERRSIATARSDVAQIRVLLDAAESNAAVINLAAAVEHCAAQFERERAAAARAAVPAAEAASDWQAVTAVETAAGQVDTVQRHLTAQRRGVALAFTRTWERWFYASLIASVLLIFCCFLALLREVRTRRRAEVALAGSHALLAESAEGYQRLIDNIPSAVWTMGEDGSVRFVSQRVKSLIGFTPAEVVAAGTRIWEQVEAPDRQMWHEGVSRLFQTGAALEMQIRVRRKNGTLVWLQVRGTRVYMRDGKRYADGILVDETERQRQEMLEREKLELELRSREAERASRLKSEFIANVSHELRTPLTSILGFSDLMLQNVGGTLTESHARFAAHIHEDGEYLLRLINDILDLSRIESGQVLLSLAAVDLAAAAAEACSGVAALAARNRVHLTCEVEPGLCVHADAVRLRQIFYNLLGNALKFTPENGSVALRAEGRDGMAQISVADTGIGIAAAEQERIFEKFHQVGESLRGSNEGSGLGLAITRQLVEMQGGRITVSSEPGRGSRFLFTLRLAAPRAHAEAQRWLHAESA